MEATSEGAESEGESERGRVTGVPVEAEGPCRRGRTRGGRFRVVNAEGATAPPNPPFHSQKLALQLWVQKECNALLWSNG